MFVVGEDQDGTVAVVVFAGGQSVQVGRHHRVADPHATLHPLLTIGPGQRRVVREQTGGGTGAEFGVPQRFRRVVLGELRCPGGEQPREVVGDQPQFADLRRVADGLRGVHRGGGIGPPGFVAEQILDPGPRVRHGRAVGRQEGVQCVEGGARAVRPALRAVLHRRVESGEPHLVGRGTGPVVLAEPGHQRAVGRMRPRTRG